MEDPERRRRKSTGHSPGSAQEMTGGGQRTDAGGGWPSRSGGPQLGVRARLPAVWSSVKSHCSEKKGLVSAPTPRAALPASRAGAPLRLQAEGSLPSRGRALALPIPTSDLPGPALAHIRRLLSPTAAPSVPPAPHPDPPGTRARTISAARLGRAFPGGNGSDSRTQPQL